MVALAVPALTEKVLAGERISGAEALELYRFPLPELGALADARRRQSTGDAYNACGDEIVELLAFIGDHIPGHAPPPPPPPPGLSLDKE